MVKKRLAILGLVFALTGTTVFGHCYNPSVVYAEEGTEIDVKSIDGFKNYWSFDTYEGSNVTSDAGAVEATGVLKNGATIADSGSPVFGDALCLTGETGNAMDLSSYIDTAGKNTSFSMWYKCTANVTGDGGKSVVLVQHGHTGSDTGRTILSLETDGKYKAYLNGNDDAKSLSDVETNVWQHITVTFDQTNYKVYFYINGVSSGEIALGSDKKTGTLNLRLGAHKGNSNPMKGYIDEFYVFEKALDSDEAMAVYNEKISEYKALLDEKIEEAEELYSNMEAEVAKGGVLDEAQETAFEAIDSAIVGGNAVAENASVEEFENAIDAIETAITNLRNIYLNEVSCAGYSLILNGTIDLNFKMELEDEDAVALGQKGAYMNFTLDGKDYSKVFVAGLEKDEDTGFYEFKCGVPVKDMGKDVQAQMIVPGGDGTAERKGLVYTYSVKKYIDYTRENSDTEKLVALVEAMSDFGEYATAYFNKDYTLGTVYGTDAIAEITAADLSE